MTQTPMTWERAFEVLELAPDASAKDLKRAYRRAVAANPPDRAPEAFEQIRAAFELLDDPTAAYQMLHRPDAATPPLRVRRPATVEVERDLPLAVLRVHVSGLEVDALLGGRDDG